MFLHLFRCNRRHHIDVRFDLRLQGQKAFDIRWIASQWYCRFDSFSRNGCHSASQLSYDYCLILSSKTCSPWRHLRPSLRIGQELNRLLAGLQYSRSGEDLHNYTSQRSEGTLANNKFHSWTNKGSDIADCSQFEQFYAIINYTI